MAERQGRTINWGTLALIVLLHVAAVFGLARAFAPDFTASVVRQATSLVTVTVRTPPPPPPPPAPTPSPVPDEGTAAPPAPKTKPKEVSAPKPKIPLPTPSPVPPAASIGTENASGAAEQGSGSGAGGEGTGTGSGTAGNGPGGLSRGLEKIAGNIFDARDYPRKGRKARKGHDVVIELRVGANGQVTSCRVTDPSPDSVADAITCRLATERFRFRPALDARGNPVPGRFLWRQQWF